MIWHGYLGPGRITLLTSQWKSGKTTLVSLLLARLQHGGQLLDLPVTPGRTLVITEEAPADWQHRFQHLAIHDGADLLCRPFTTQPTLVQWLALIDTALVLHESHGTTLLVIDSLAQFLPAHSENSASILLECLTPLQRLTSAGLSVLLVHHPRKGKTVAGQAARGSGALSSFVDILIEMGYHSHPDDLDRRRRLLAFSRHNETPRHLLVELQADGTDYTVLQSGLEAISNELWQPALDTLARATRKLTRQDILDDWPADFDKPDKTSLWRWLKRLVECGQLRLEGTGRAHDPFRYWLVAREEMMFPDQGTREQVQAWNDRVLAEWWATLPPLPEPRPTETPAPPGPASSSSDAPLPAEPAPLPEPEAETVPAPPPPPRSRDIAARLPYPWNQMKPEDIPEDVWQRALEAEA